MFSEVNYPMVNTHCLSHYYLVYCGLELEDCPIQLRLTLKQDAANPYIAELGPTIVHLTHSLMMQVGE